MRHLQDKPTEQSDQRQYLTFEQAAALLPDGDYVHVFSNLYGALLGADWRRQQVLDFFREHEGKIERSGGMASGMGYGLAFVGERRLFFATRADT